MLSIYTASQIKEIEQLTCKEQEITSLQLMERAGQVFSLWFSQQFKNKSKALHIFCGNGNNGGDGLVIARLLNISGYTINVYLIPIGPTSTPDNATNLEKLNDYPSITLYPLSIDNYFLPEINQDDIIIDAILGTGANRPIDENWKKLFDWINSRSNIKISVDLPSGLPTDSVFSGTVIHSDYVLGFEFPKLSYLLPEHSNYIKNWIVESIRLTKNIPKTLTTTKNIIERKDIKNIILPRNKFSYKNNFGHMLLIAGSKSMCGASILSAKAAMRSGLGLITVITDADCKAHLFSQFPEAMVNEYEEFFPLIINKFNSICVGSGMKGIENMESILNKCYSAKISMILDAEAIQALASNPNLLKKIPANTILTPHIGEFEKLVNKKFENSIDRLQFAASFALKHKIIIVLKGSNTCVINSDGMQYFNTTGNQGMATAGSGDVLAGIIGSLLAQSYQPIHAAIIGVYIHGLSGDLALKKQSYESMIASDISENLGDAFKELEPKELF